MSCQSSATETQYGTSIGTSDSVTFSDSSTTLPDTTTTVVLPCPATSDAPPPPSAPPSAPPSSPPPVSPPAPTSPSDIPSSAAPTASPSDPPPTPSNYPPTASPTDSPTASPSTPTHDPPVNSPTESPTASPTAPAHDPPSNSPAESPPVSPSAPAQNPPVNPPTESPPASGPPNVAAPDPPSALQIAPRAPCDPVTVTSVIPGGVSAVQVPITVQVTYTTTYTTKILYAPCTSDPPDPITKTIMSTRTPPPTTITMRSSSTRADGSIFINSVVVVSTMTPSTVAVPTTVQRNESTGGKQVGRIVGCTAGGIAAAIAIVWFIWFILKRRRHWDDLFDREDDRAIERSIRDYRDPNARVDLENETDPYPYQYGLATQYSHSVSSVTNFDPAMMVSNDPSPGLNAHGRQLSSSQTILPPGATTYYNQPQDPYSSWGIHPLSIQTRMVSRQPEFVESPSSTSLHRQNSVPVHVNHYPSPDGIIYVDTGPQRSTSGASGSQSQGEEQVQQMQLANPSPNSPVAPAATSVDRKAVGRRLRTNKQQVIGRSGRRSGVAATAGPRSGGPEDEPHQPPPPAYAERPP